MSSPVVQAGKGSIAEVTWVTFSGGNDDRAGMGMSVGVCVMGMGTAGAMCGAGSAACAMCRRCGGRVHNVLWIWGHVIIGFDGRARTCGRGGSSG